MYFLLYSEILKLLHKNFNRSIFTYNTVNPLSFTSFYCIHQHCNKGRGQKILFDLKKIIYFYKLHKFISNVFICFTIVFSFNNNGGKFSPPTVGQRAFAQIKTITCYGFILLIPYYFYKYLKIFVFTFFV